VTVAQGEVFDPSPANIESRVARSKLANGMKVVVVPKKTDGNLVSAVIELRFGDAQTLAGKMQWQWSLDHCSTREHVPGTVNNSQTKCASSTFASKSAEEAGAEVAAAAVEASDPRPHSPERTPPSQRPQRTLRRHFASQSKC
jgi:hypothetical protein